MTLKWTVTAVKCMRQKEWNYCFNRISQWSKELLYELNIFTMVYVCRFRCLIQNSSQFFILFPRNMKHSNNDKYPQKEAFEVAIQREKRTLTTFKGKKCQSLRGAQVCLRMVLIKSFRTQSKYITTWYFDKTRRIFNNSMGLFGGTAEKSPNNSHRFKIIMIEALFVRL